MSEDQSFWGIPVQELREDFGEYFSFQAALRVVLLACAASSGLKIVVDGETVPIENLVDLVPWESEEDEELMVRISEDQARMTPTLVVSCDREEFVLARTESGLDWESLRAYLADRSSILLSASRELMDLRLGLMRKYPELLREDPEYFSL